MEKDNKGQNPRRRSVTPIGEKREVINIADLAHCIIDGIKRTAAEGKEVRTKFDEVIKIVAAANGEVVSKKKYIVQDMFPVIFGNDNSWQAFYDQHISQLKNKFEAAKTLAIKKPTKENEEAAAIARLQLTWWEDAGVNTLIRKWGSYASPSDEIDSNFIDRFVNKYDSPYDYKIEVADNFTFNNIEEEEDDDNFGDYDDDNEVSE